MTIERDFRGVVHSGVVLDDGNLALVVGHPHPNGDFGGGPGPDDTWAEPYDHDAYTSLVADACDPDDASFELRALRHVAVGRAGAWSLIELPAAGTITELRRLPSGALGLLVSYGGGAFYAVRCTPDATLIDALEYHGQPRMWIESRAAWCGAAVVLAGSESSGPGEPSQVGLAVAEGDAMVWREALGTVPGRVLALHADDIDGTREIVAGGARLWGYRDGTWESLHDPMFGSITFVDRLGDGELVAGTDRGSVIVGRGADYRTIGKVDESTRPPGSATRSTSPMTNACIATAKAGSRSACACRRTAGDWPCAGRLVATADALWLMGSHAIIRTSDGSTWHPVAVR